MRGALMATALILAAAVAPAAMASTTYTSSAAFNAATSGLSVEDYGAYAAGQLIANGGSLGALTYSFNTASGLGGVVTNDYNSVTGLSLAAKQSSGPLNGLDFFYSNEGFTVTLPSAVRAFGIFANVNLPTGLSLLTSGGDSAQTTVTAYDQSTFGFLGIVSSTPFNAVTFLTDNSANIPEIEYGAAAGVPEPASWALMIGGLGLTGVALRHRRRQIAV